jgi:methylmalonyl-CoA mutase C-terminal domain/subunit
MGLLTVRRRLGRGHRFSAPVKVKHRDGESGAMSTDHRERTIRCLIAKAGLDGHDRGAHVIARAFRDAGFEVVYSGLHRAPEEVVQAAVQEDVDVLGISILSGAHNTLVPKIIDGLKEYDAFEDTLVLVGGIVPDDDRERLKELGVAEVFGPGTPSSRICSPVTTGRSPGPSRKSRTAPRGTGTSSRRCTNTPATRTSWESPGVRARASPR